MGKIAVMKPLDRWLEQLGIAEAALIAVALRIEKESSRGEASVYATAQVAPQHFYNWVEALAALANAGLIEPVPPDVLALADLRTEPMVIGS
jgi:hypothetical protein